MAYDSLYRRYSGQDIRTVFANFWFNREKAETWESPFESLAKLAKPEDWGFRTDEFQQRYSSKYPILMNYLNYTFLRVYRQNWITYVSTAEGERACFNTGLQTPKERDIYALFYKTRDLKNADWTFFCFADSYAGSTSCYRPLPPVPTYITDPGDLIFDTKLELDVNYDHILGDNIDRFPEVLRNNATMALRALTGAIESLKDRIVRNYKLAIPHWHEDKIQLLLPLNLVSTDNAADLALVVDKDKAANIYKARTILTMDLAYMNARLVAHPDRDWLNP